MKKTIKRLTVIGVIAMAFFLDACLKNEPWYTDFSKVGDIIEFLDSTEGIAKSVSFPLPLPDTSVIIVRVNQTGVNATSKDIVVNIGISAAALALYNQDASHVVGVALPTNAFSFPSSVTIKAGKDTLNNPNRTAQFELLIFPKLIPTLPLGTNYVVGLEITGASAGTVSGNISTILFNFYHNIYDGSYHSVGTRWNFATSGDYAGWDPVAQAPAAGSVLVSTAPWDFNANILTVNATTSSVHAGNDPAGFGNMNIIVNGDNTVTIQSSCPANDGSCAPPQTALAALVPLPQTTSTWDPVHRVFDLYYQYTNTTGTFRVLHDLETHN
jgi:Domain of unknown function (DUF1735)